jgi:CRP-like cAMP-binding protein
MLHPLKEILRHEIKGLTETELDDFVSRWRIRKQLKRNELLYPIGKAEKNIYFIESGSMKIGYQLNEQEIIVGFGYPNTFIFDLPSFFTGKPSNFHIQAIKACSLFGISKTDFYELLDTNLTIAKYWRSRTELILLDLVEREVDILTNSPEERFQRLQQRRPDLFQQIPHKYIATYLRMTPETLSRLKKS